MLAIKIILFEIIEFRLFNDILSTFMGLIIFFSVFNYSGLEFNEILPTSLSFGFGLTIIIILVVMGYITKKNSHDVFIEDDHYESDFETKF